MLVRLAAMPDVVRHVGPGTPWPDAMAVAVSQAQLDHWRTHGFGWRVAIERATDKPIGFIALNFAGAGTVKLDASEYEIGWWLEPAAWGQGYAREGAAAGRDEAFDALGAPSVIARIQPGNERSIRVAESLGLEFDLQTTARNGETVDIYRLNNPAKSL